MNRERSKEETCESTRLRFALAATRANAAPFAHAPKAATDTALVHPTKAGEFNLLPLFPS